MRKFYILLLILPIYINAATPAFSKRKTLEDKDNRIANAPVEKIAEQIVVNDDPVSNVITVSSEKISVGKINKSFGNLITGGFINVALTGEKTKSQAITDEAYIFTTIDRKSGTKNYRIIFSNYQLNSNAEYKSATINYNNKDENIFDIAKSDYHNGSTGGYYFSTGFGGRGYQPPSFWNSRNYSVYLNSEIISALNLTDETKKFDPIIVKLIYPNGEAGQIFKFYPSEIKAIVQRTNRVDAVRTAPVAAPK